MTKLLRFLVVYTIAIILLTIFTIFISVKIVVGQDAPPDGSVYTEDGRIFKVFAICKYQWSVNEGTWAAKFGWYANTDFVITSEIIGANGWNLVGAHPVNQMYAGTSTDSFSVIFMDENGYPTPDAVITFRITDWAGNVSEADATLLLPVCKPRVTPRPTIVPAVEAVHIQIAPTIVPQQNRVYWAQVKDSNGLKYWSRVTVTGVVLDPPPATQ